MAKRLFLLLCSLVGVVLAPASLMAEDGFLVKPSFTQAVETVIVIEEPEPVVQPILALGPNNFEAPVQQWVPPANSISIAGRTIETFWVSDTIVDSGNHVNRYGDKFLYGHNSWNVFGGLVNVPENSVFTITTDGVARDYVVAKKVIYEKNVPLGRLQLNGKGSYMAAVANAIELRDDATVEYALAIMTCYGTPYEGGDASHRLVLFANAL